MRVFQLIFPIIISLFAVILFNGCSEEPKPPPAVVEIPRCTKSKYPNRTDWGTKCKGTYIVTDACTERNPTEADREKCTKDEADKKAEEERLAEENTIITRSGASNFSTLRMFPPVAITAKARLKPAQLEPQDILSTTTDAEENQVGALVAMEETQTDLEKWLDLGAKNKDCLVGWSFDAFANKRFSVVGDSKSQTDKTAALAAAAAVNSASTMRDYVKPRVREFAVIREDIGKFVASLNCMLNQLNMTDLYASASASDYSDYKDQLQSILTTEVDTLFNGSDGTTTTASSDDAAASDGSLGALVTNEEVQTTTTESSDNDLSGTDSSTSTSSSKFSIGRAYLNRYYDQKLGTLKTPMQKFQNRLTFTIHFSEGDVTFKINSVALSRDKRVKGDMYITLTQTPSGGQAKSQFIGLRYYLRKDSSGYAIEITHIPNFSADTTKQAAIEGSFFGLGKKRMYMVNSQGNTTYHHRFVRYYLPGTTGYGKYQSIQVQPESTKVEDIVVAWRSNATCASVNTIEGSATTSGEKECFDKNGLVTWDRHNGLLAPAITSFSHARHIVAVSARFHEVPVEKNVTDAGSYSFDYNQTTPAVEFASSYNQLTSSEGDAVSHIVQGGYFESASDFTSENTSYSGVDRSPITTLPAYAPPNFFASTINDGYWEDYCSSNTKDPFWCAAARIERYESKAEQTVTADPATTTP